MADNVSPPGDSGQPTPHVDSKHEATSSSKPVGYRSPPRHSQFRKGASGNPKGRPKGARNKPPTRSRFSEMFMAEGEKLIPGQPKNGITRMQAIIQSSFAQALKGRIGHTRLLIDTRHQIEREHHKAILRSSEAVGDYMAQMGAQMAEARAAGRPMPEMFPHPADIRQDEETGDIFIVGPRNATDVEAWKIIDQRLELLISTNIQIDEVEQKLATAKGVRKRDSAAKQLDALRSLAKSLDRDLQNLSSEDRAWRWNRIMPKPE